MSTSDGTVVSLERHERIKCKGEEWVEGSTPAETRGSSRDAERTESTPGESLYFLRVGSSTTVLAGSRSGLTSASGLNGLEVFLICLETDGNEVIFI